MRLGIGLLIVLGLSAAGGCGSYTYVNKPEKQPNLTRASVLPLPSTNPSPSLADEPASASRSDPRDDGAFVGIALSGGGSRSANFAAACMMRLDRIGLLDRADYISSVSGGSVVAAYYCLSEPGGKEWTAKHVRKALSFPFATEGLGQVLLPWEFLATLLTDYDRSDVLAEVFKRHLFSREGKALTFADLRADRPRLLINATNLDDGKAFTFCNQAFDGIRSDLSQYPLAYAVTASAAVPGLLHQVTLRDFSYEAPKERPRQKRYVHLLDGGIVDNLGLQTLLDTYQARIKDAAEHGLPDPFPKGAAIIAIDAMNHADPQLTYKGDAGFLESLLAGADVAATVLLSGAGSTTLEHTVLRNIGGETSVDQARAQISRLEKSGYLSFKGRDGRPIRLVHLALDRAKDLPNPPGEKLQHRLNNIPTSFDITGEDLDGLYKAADMLVDQRFEPILRGLLGEIDAAPEEAPSTAPSGPPTSGRSVSSGRPVRRGR